jgi:hypothetical protein
MAHLGHKGLKHFILVKHNHLFEKAIVVLAKRDGNRG